MRRRATRCVQTTIIIANQIFLVACVALFCVAVWLPEASAVDRWLSGGLAAFALGLNLYVIAATERARREQFRPDPDDPRRPMNQ